MSKLKFKCKFCDTLLESNWDVSDHTNINIAACPKCNVLMGINDQSLEIRWMEFKHISAYTCVTIMSDELMSNYNENSNILLISKNNNKNKSINLFVPNIINEVTPQNILKFLNRIDSMKVFL